MSANFPGFSEDDLKRIQSNESETDTSSGTDFNLNSNAKRIYKLGAKPKKVTNQYTLPILQNQDSDEAMNNIFDKCKLSIKTPTSPDDIINKYECEINFNVSSSESSGKSHLNSNFNTMHDSSHTSEAEIICTDDIKKQRPSLEETETISNDEMDSDVRRSSSGKAPDIIRCADNYTEDEIAAHKAKLEELQLKQRLMEEQNKMRKEMLAKALADRTRQTEEEVLRLEKIKKELQVLDGQFSQDVAVLRKKIDQACLTFAEAEKHYLRIEKEFLQAKINLQKEKEKKELLTEHLCALITHNETRKAEKLETLMLELATDSKPDVNKSIDPISPSTVLEAEENPVIVDGVDEKTGKIVELTKS